MQAVTAIKGRQGSHKAIHRRTRDTAFHRGQVTNELVTNELWPKGLQNIKVEYTCTYLQNASWNRLAQGGTWM